MLYNPHQQRVSCMLWFIAIVACANAASGDEDASLDFNRDLMPLLSKNCVACHNAKQTEGGLNLESFAALTVGSDSGNLLTAADDASKSLLVERMMSEDDPMPPDGNAVGAVRMSTNEVELFSKWIAAGAKPPTMEPIRSLKWQPLPSALQPVVAMATSPDGNYLSYGRGNNVSITKLVAGSPEGGRTQTLLDAEVNKTVPDAAPSTHLDIVQSIAFSPDSQRLATGGFRTVKIWLRQTAPSFQLDGLSRPDGVSAISEDGRWIAQSSGNSTIEITDCMSGQSHRFLKTHVAKITALAWLAGSQSLLSCDESGKLALTRADSNQVMNILCETPLQVTALKAIGESRCVAVDTQQRLVDLLLEVSPDGQSATCATTLRDQLGPIDHVAVNGQQLAVASTSGKISLVNLADFQVAKTLESKIEIRALEVSHDGGLVAAIPQSGPAQVWRVEDGQLLATLDQDYDKSRMVRTAARDAARQKSLVEHLAAEVPALQKASEEELAAAKKVQEARDKAAEALATKVTEVDAANAAVAEAEKLLADSQAAVAEAMKLVEAKTAELEAKRKAIAEVEQKKAEAAGELAKREQALVTANDGVARANAKIPVLEQQIAQEKEQLTGLESDAQQAEAIPVATDQPLTMAFTPDNARVVVAHADGRVRVFSPNSGVPESNQPAASQVRSMRVTSDNGLLCLTNEGSVQRWDLSYPWVLERTIGSFSESPFSDRITALDFSPDGRMLAIGSGPPSRFGDIKIMDVASGEIVKDLGEAHSDSVLGLRFSPDGRQLATAGADRLCRVFNVASGELTRTLEGHTHHVLGVAWKDDGQTLVTASADATMKIWDVDSGTQLRTVGGLNKEISAVSFVGSSSQFVLASTDGTAKLVNADDGKHIRTFGGASNALYTVALSSGNEQIYAGGQSGEILAWKLDDAKLLTKLP